MNYQHRLVQTLTPLANLYLITRLPLRQGLRLCSSGALAPAPARTPATAPASLTEEQLEEIFSSAASSHQLEDNWEEVMEMVRRSEGVLPNTRWTQGFEANNKIVVQSHRGGLAEGSS